MIVRELITRLGFTTDQRGADQYDRRLRKLREDAEKSAQKLSATEAQRIARMARAETSVARLRGAQFKALQETERRELGLEQQRQRGRERAEAHQRRMERLKRQDDRAQHRHLNALAAARQREADAQRRRTQALANMQELHANRQLRQLQVRNHAENRLQMQRETAARRHAMNTSRQAAFDQRQAHMRRAELLREENIRLRNLQIQRQTAAIGRNARATGGGFMAAGIGAGVSGYGLAALAGRVDEMTGYNTRLNTYFGTADAASRDRELFSLAQLGGMSVASAGNIAYKTQRSASALGIEGMNRDRALGVTEAIALGSALSGSSSEAVNAALIQLFQGIESNRFSGEELRSVMEQTPELARAIATGAGYANLGDFRNAAHAGELTGKVVIEALEKQLPELRARAGEIPITFSRTAQQMSNTINMLLLDMQKGADVTGKFNRAFMSLVNSMDRKIREIVANMGGWEVATEKLVSVIAAVAIPVIIRLAMTIATYMGPLALLAAPLAFVFSSLLEFARKYPNEWQEGIAKIRNALSNLIDSILYVLGMRLKPYNSANATELGRINLTNKGNGIVEYEGKEYRNDSAELSQAILANNPGMADQIRREGGRMRIMQGDKLLAEVQTLPGGDTAASTWVSAMEVLSTGINDLATWFTDTKPTFVRIADNLGRVADLLGRIPGLADVGGRVGSAGKIGSGVLDVLSGEVTQGGKKMVSGAYELSPVAAVLGAASELKDEMTYNARRRTSSENLRYTGANGNQMNVRIENIDVHVKEAGTRESFIQAVNSAGKEAISQALGRQGPFVYPIEDTSRATE